MVNDKMVNGSDLWHIDECKSNNKLSNQFVVHEQINKQLSSQCKNIWGQPQGWQLQYHIRKRKKERTVDALALGGDEGRGKLR